MFYTQSPTASGTTLSFTANFQPGDVIQFLSPVSNSNGASTFTAVMENGASYPMTYSGNETFPPYFLYVGQTYLMVFTGTYFEVTSQTVTGSQGTVNTAPLVVNNFIDPSATGLLSVQMADLQTLVEDMSQVTDFTEAVSMTAGLSVTGNLSVSGQIDGTATNALALGGIPASGYAPLNGAAFTTSPTAPTPPLSASVDTVATVGTVVAMNNAQLGSISQINNDLTVAGTVTASAATGPDELVILDQITGGSLNPQFNLILRDAQQHNQNYLPNSSFLYGFAGWQTAPGNTVAASYNNSTYAAYIGSSDVQQYWNSGSATWGLPPGSTVNLSGWIYNVGSTGDATLALQCFDGSGSTISTICSSSVPSGQAWTFVTATGTLPASTSTVEVQLGWQGSSSGSNISFSQLKLEEGDLPSRWTDEASASLFSNGQLSPTFDDLTLQGGLTVDGATTLNTLNTQSITVSGTVIADGLISVNSAWSTGQTGLSIGDVAGQGEAGLLLNAPASYDYWLVQVGLGGEVVFYIEANGNTVIDGYCTANAFSAIDSGTLTGTTSGSIIYSMPSQGTAKKFVAYVDAYENDTSTSQTIDFPTAFTYPPLVTNSVSGLSVSATTTTLTITAPNATTNYSGVIIVEGL